MQNITYVDSFINDGKREYVSLRNLYDTMLVQDDDNVFKIAINDFFLKYKLELEDALEFYALPEGLFYKPKLLSLQKYGTTELWLALLRANNMKNITEFHLPIIRIYNPDRLNEIMRVIFKREKKM